MKTAIYIEDGLLQVVVTPENEFEKKALSMFQNKPLDAQIFSGSFYDCRGGWVRQSAYYPRTTFQDGDMSLILRIAEPKPDDPAASPFIAPIALYSAPDNPIEKLDEMIAAGEPRSDAE